MAFGLLSSADKTAGEACEFQGIPLPTDLQNLIYASGMSSATFLVH